MHSVFVVCLLVGAVRGCIYGLNRSRWIASGLTTLYR
jgi:hypothetical protein